MHTAAAVALGIGAGIRTQQRGGSPLEIGGSFLTAGTVVGSVVEGIAIKREAESAAAFADFNATAAVLEGRRKALVELERVNAEQARQFAAVGASGILPSGSGAAAAIETGRKGKASFELAQLGGAIAGRAESLQAEALRRRGRIAVFGGFAQGASRAARLISLGNQ